MLPDKNIFFKLLASLLSRFSAYYWAIFYRSYRAKFELDDSFRFNGRSIVLYGEGRIVAGAGSYIGSLSTLQAAKGCVIRIGEQCKISHNVRIYTQTAIADADFSERSAPNRCGDVSFGSYCWIGANVFVNPGVTIGENAVVGANSVVTKDIPPFEIWGGVPARFIRKKVIKKEVS